MCAIGTKPTAPCPPTPPPPIEERLVGLPGKEIVFSAVETKEAEASDDFYHIVPKLKDSKATQKMVNRRGNRNH